MCECACLWKPGNWKNVVRRKKVEIGGKMWLLSYVEREMATEACKASTEMIPTVLDFFIFKYFTFTTWPF